MADARTAILITLDVNHEGGYQRNPNDRANWTGGEVGKGELVGTNGGITALDVPLGTDIEHMTEEFKINYYYLGGKYWKPLYSQIASQVVANKIFDLGVLFGIGTTVEYLQEVVGLKPDGLFGPETLLAVNAEHDTTLLPAFKSRLHQYVKDVVEKRPTDAEFASDWNRRIDS